MKFNPKLTPAEVGQNHKYFIERVTLYKKKGLDFEKSKEFILEKAGPLKGRILEIGAGSGYTTLSLAKAGYKFISIDNDKEALKKTALNLAYEDLLSNVEFYVMDGRALSFDDRTFQNVVIVNLFHHISDIDGILAQTDRVLCTNGKIIMADFNKRGMEIINSVHRYEDRMHEDLGISKDYIRSYFNGLGYKIREFKDRYHWVLIVEKKIQQ